MSVLCLDIKLAGQTMLRDTNIDVGRYRYTGDLLRLEDCTENNCSVTWPAYRSLVLLTNWAPFLASHSDRGFASLARPGAFTSDLTDRLVI